MVKTHPLFRRRLTIDPQVKDAAKRLVAQYQTTGRPEVVGKIFQPLFHNYLYGETRTALVERITHLVKRENKSLQQIWASQKWLNAKNKEDARSLSVMGLEVDEWVVRFSEILLIDIKELYEKSNNGVFYALPIEMILFYYVFGFKHMWKILGVSTLAGVGVSESIHIYKESKGFSAISFAWYGVMIQKLISSGKFLSLPGIILAFASLLPLYADPPSQGQWFTLQGAKHTDHLVHYIALAVGILLQWSRVV